MNSNRYVLNQLRESKEDEEIQLDCYELESLLNTDERIILQLEPSYADILLSCKDQLEVSSEMNWSHLETGNPRQIFSLDDCQKQFIALEKLYDEKCVRENPENEAFFKNKKRDELKIAIEHYKLAIMEGMLSSLRHEEKKKEEMPPSGWVHGIYYFLLLGGSWISFLHGYDAAQAIASIIPTAVSSAIVWGLGSFMAMIALAIFAAFEAEELSKHLGFRSVKNLETTLDLNKRQIEVTHEFQKRLAIHSEHHRVSSARDYQSYAHFALLFDRTLTKTKQSVVGFTESKGRKIAKTTLIVCGMAFTAADSLFLAVGFGALALSGPVGWILLSVTAILGAALFYVAFNKMIRNKVAPALKKKEEILKSVAYYEKDELMQGIDERLKMKKLMEKLEGEVTLSRSSHSQTESLLAEVKIKDEKLQNLHQENNDQRKKIVELNKALADAKRSILEKDFIIERQARKQHQPDARMPSTPGLNKSQLLEFSPFKPVPITARSEHNPRGESPSIFKDYF